MPLSSVYYKNDVQGLYVPPSTNHTDEVVNDTQSERVDNGDLHSSMKKRNRAQRKAKKVKVRDHRRRRPSTPNIFDTDGELSHRNSPVSQNVNISVTRGGAELCEYERELLLKMDMLEERLLKLEMALIELMSKDQNATLLNNNSSKTPAKKPKAKTLKQTSDTTQTFVKKNSGLFLNETLTTKVEPAHQVEPTVYQQHQPYYHDGYNLLPKTTRQPKILRRCTRKRVERCNFIEYHTTVNPVLLYFVCAFMISMLRAMRITVSFYVCPVIDDWRDALRRRLPENLKRALFRWNVRF